MHQLPSEILLASFKHLNSLEMVHMMRVCKDWLEIIDENRNLWRRLVLPAKEMKEDATEERGWGLSLVKLFDNKSNNQLEEVSMDIKIEDQELPTFLDLLDKSNKSLRILYLSAVGNRWLTQEALSDPCWRLSNLTDCRIIRCNDKVLVRLVERDIRKKMDGCKVLWTITGSSCRKALSKAPHRFSHLISLKIGYAHKAVDLIATLNHCSQSLKHLAILLHGQEGRLPSFRNLAKGIGFYHSQKESV